MKQNKYLTIVLLLSIHLGVFAQTDPQQAPSNVYTDKDGNRYIPLEPAAQPSISLATPQKNTSDKEPQFPGGEEAMLRFVEQNLKYHLADDDDEGNTVTLAFTVTSVGFRTQIKVLKNLSYACDKEAVRVLDAMPLWEPGMRDGRAVSMDYVLDIVFDRKEKSQAEYIYTTASSAPRAPQVVDGFNITNPEIEVVVADKPPHFPDGDYAMWQFIDQNMDVNLLEKDASGDQIVSFDVTETGQIVNVLIDKTLGAEYDKEAVRLVKSMPRWTPGIKNGKAVKMTYRLAIPF